jgi:hypothetical protein
MAWEKGHPPEQQLQCQQRLMFVSELSMILLQKAGALCDVKIVPSVCRPMEIPFGKKL